MLTTSTATTTPSTTWLPPLTTLPYHEIPCDTNYPTTLSATGGAIGMREKYTCYDVTGSTPDEISASIRASPSRPLDINGVRFTATTGSVFQLNWTNVAANNECRPTLLSAFLWVEQILPRWVPAATGPSSMPPQWIPIFTVLRTHEDQHKQIAIDATRDAMAHVIKLRAPDCVQLDALAQTAIADAKAVQRQRNEGLDAATNHGVAPEIRPF